jgi:hypothetical protein
MQTLKSGLKIGEYGLQCVSRPKTIYVFRCGES